MARHAQPPTAAPAPEVRWGIGDALVGFLVTLVVASVIGATVVSAAGYESALWSERGAAVGRLAGQAAAGGAEALGRPDLVPMWLLVLLQVPQWTGLVATVAWAGIRKGRGIVRDFGFAFRREDVPLGLAIGVVCQLVVVPLLYVPILRLVGERDVSAEARALTDRATGIGVALFILLAVVGAPLVEELFFRGLVLRAFERRFGVPVAVAVSSVFFGVVHFQVLQFPALAVFGLVTALLAVSTGRLGPSVWAHVGFNGTTAALLLLTR